MKRLYLISGVMVSLFLIGCGVGEKEEPYSEKYDIINPGYVFEEFEESKETKNPYGILLSQNKIMVCDFGGNCINIYDMDGKFEKSVGKTGSGRGEFVRPIDMEEYNGEYYVLDSGNERVEIFDLDFNYLSEIACEEVGGENQYMRYDGITVSDKGEIYLDIVSSNEKISKIQYRQTKTSKWKKLSTSLYGSMRNCEGKVYAVNRMSFGEQSSSSWSIQADDTYMYSYNGKQRQRLFRFPDQFMPWQFVILKNDIYVVSVQDISLQHWNLEGKYIETICPFPDYTIDQEDNRRWEAEYNDLVLDEKGNFYLTLNGSGIYKITKVK